MKILLNNNDLNKALIRVNNLGFVPTMGSLHKGHISLINRSKKDSNKTLVSIFVNPTQFNNKKDFKRYPRNIKNDLSKLRKLYVDFVYIPTKSEVYNFKRKKKIKIKNKDNVLCAKFRKGHFEGVIDVMDRLTKLIKPDKIFMGEKDFQQIYLIKKYINKKYKNRIVTCKTIRDKNQLALSSRNKLLSKKSLILASKYIKEIKILKKNFLVKNININNFLKSKKYVFEKLFKIKIDYLELRTKKNLKKTNIKKDSKIFTAFYVNKVRLIDNF